MRNVEVLAQRGALTQAGELVERFESLYGQQLDTEHRRQALKLKARIAVAEGESGDAAGILEQIVEVDPLDGEALILLGQHYTRSGDVERAEFYFERAQSLDNYEGEARLRHAQLLVDQSRYGEAVPLLRRVQELNPREDVARYLEQVERVARAGR